MGSDYDGYFSRQFAKGREISSADVERMEKYSYGPFLDTCGKLAIGPGDKVLEIGSGLGNIYSHLEHRENYTGLEIDSRTAAFTNEYFGTDRFLNVSLEDFEPDGACDFIFALQVLEHLRDPLGAIEKVRGMLRDGGTFCGATPFPFGRAIGADPTHLFVLHPKNWERLFMVAGFSSVRTRAASYVPLIWRLDRRLNRGLPFYVPIRYVVSDTIITAVA
jgi:SAM-dependent methyltransferase